MQTAEQIAKLEKRQAELSQELDGFMAEQARMLEERKILSFGALVEGDKIAQKSMEELSRKLAEVATRVGERQEALAVLEGKLGDLRETLRLEELAKAGRACLEALISAYKLRAEIEELTKQAEAKWQQIEGFQSIASKHRAAVVKFGGKKEDFPIPLTFRENQDGQTVLMLRKLEAQLNR